MTLTERLAIEVKQLSHQINDLANTIDALKREVEHVPVRTCQLARRLELKNDREVRADV